MERLFSLDDVKFREDCRAVPAHLRRLGGFALEGALTDDPDARIVAAPGLFVKWVCRMNRDCSTPRTMSRIAFTSCVFLALWLGSLDSSPWQRVGLEFRVWMESLLGPRTRFCLWVSASLCTGPSKRMRLSFVGVDCCCLIGLTFWWIFAPPESG